MERVLRASSVAAVVALGIPPAFELGSIGHPNQRLLAASLFAFAAAAGVYAAVRRRPLGLRITTVAYAAIVLGFGLFATVRPISYLFAYVVGLLAMNVLVYHAATYGPVLAAFREEDAISRRARAVAVRSLALSGVALVLAYGGSLALLPAFASGIGVRDPLSALALAGGVIVVLLLLALLPMSPLALRRRRRPRLS